MIRAPHMHALRPAGLPRLKILGESPKAFHIQSLSAEGHPIGGPMLVARLGMTPEHEGRIRMLAKGGDDDDAPTASIAKQGEALRETRNSVAVAPPPQADNTAPKVGVSDPNFAPVSVAGGPASPDNGKKKAAAPSGGGSGGSSGSGSKLLDSLGQKHTPLYNLLHPEEAALDKRHDNNLLEQAKRNQDKEDANMIASDPYLTGSSPLRTLANATNDPSVSSGATSPDFVNRGSITPDVTATVNQSATPLPATTAQPDPASQVSVAAPTPPLTTDLSPNTGADFSPQTDPFAMQPDDQLQQSDFAAAAPIAEEAHGGEIHGPHITDEDADTVTVRLAQGGSVKVPRWALHPELLKAMPRAPKTRKMADGGETESVDAGIARMNALSQAQHTAQGDRTTASTEAQDESVAFETPTASQAAQNEIDNIKRRAADEQERATSTYRAAHGPQKTIDGEDFDPSTAADESARPEARGGLIRQTRMMAVNGDPLTAPVADLPISGPSVAGISPDEHAAAVAQAEQDALGRTAVRQLLNPSTQGASTPEQAGIPLFSSSEPAPPSAPLQQSASPSVDAVNTSQQTPVPVSGAAPIDITHALASYQSPEKPALAKSATPAASILAASSAPSGGGMPRIDTTADDKSTKEARDFQAAAIGNQQVDAASIGDDLGRIEAQRATDAATIKAHFAKEYDGIQAKANDLRNQIASGDINPHQYWDNKDLGSKVTATLAMALGAFGSAISKTPNYAQAILTKAVDDDIDTQKVNLGKKESLLNNYMKAGYDIQHAEELAKADLNDVIAGQIRQVAAAHAGTQAGIAADAASSKLAGDSMKMRQNALLAAEQKAETQSKLMSDKASRDKIAYEIWAAKNAAATATPAFVPEPGDPFAQDRAFTYDPAHQKEASERQVLINEPVTVTAQDGTKVTQRRDMKRFTVSPNVTPKAYQDDAEMLDQQRKAAKELRKMVAEGSASTDWTRSREFMTRANILNLAGPKTVDEVNRVTGPELKAWNQNIDPQSGLGWWQAAATGQTKRALEVVDGILADRERALERRLRPRDSQGRP